MILLWMLFLGGFVVLPGSALLAMRWAIRNGEFRDFKKASLLIFDEEEPVGLVTDSFPTGKMVLNTGPSPATHGVSQP